MALLALSGSCLSSDEQRARSAFKLGAGDGGACGAITHQGCCDGQVLYYCEGGTILVMDCFQNPSCGWDAAAAYYDCGTGGLPDPSGAHPKTCTAVPDLGLSLDVGAASPCGVVTWEGCCHGETLHWCDNGALASVDCTDQPSCGWDAGNSWYGCGTTSTADPTGKNPKACAFDAAVPDLGAPDAALPCGDLTFEGCCDGELLHLCDNGALVSVDCTGQPSCGWMPVGAYGWYSCGTDGKADPSGKNPKACAALLDASAPDGGIPCGNVTWEGCCDGQINYHCVGGSLKVEDCRRQPSCGWGFATPYYLCGEDGFPQPAGTYPMACDFGDAGPPAIGNTCGSVTWQGCCSGQTLSYCDAGTLRVKDCGVEPLCGWKTDGAYSFYDCGTDGNADPSGKLPKACTADAGIHDASTGCGPVTHQGCCEGDTLYWCAGGALKSMDCSKSPSCGWQPAADYYDCGTDGGAAPSGAHPMACGFDGGAPVLDGPRDAAAPRDVIRDSPPAGDLAAPADDGCGCVLAPRSPGGVTLLLLLVVVVAIRRRPR